MLRIRDFIETTDKLIFSVVSYHHPLDRCIAFLRYYPYTNGNRKRGEEAFQKITSTKESYKFLETHFPGYILHLAEGSTLQCVPRETISKIYRPTERLKEIYKEHKDHLEEKTLKLSDVFSEIPRNKKGVTGSVLVGLHLENSDIDFVVYGTKNFDKARTILGNYGDGLMPLNRKQWHQAYEKRFPGKRTLTFDEFMRYEKRKSHKGVINGSIFDILFVRGYDEINEGRFDLNSRRIGRVKQRCRVVDASLAFDYPAVYKVEGESKVREVAVYTHTYAGQAFEGENIEVSGVLEEVLGEEKKHYFRIVVGTTREAEGEYIKVI